MTIILRVLIHTSPITGIITEYPPIKAHTHLEEWLALLFDLVDGELGASIANYLGVRRVQVISEQRPDGEEGGAKRKYKKNEYW